MPTFTRQASDTIVLMRVGSSNRAADDVHLTIGRGSGSHSDHIGRVEVRFPEPSNWPSAGTLTEAFLDIEESGTDVHPWFDGGSSRIEVRRLTERARFGLPGSADGHGTGGYTTEGSGDKYPGASVAGAAATANVNGHERINVTSMVRQMLPTRLGGSNELYGYFQIRSVDEDNANRSVILSRRMSLSVVIDTRTVPNEATVLEVIGAQDDTGSPTLVASDDGRTLEVRFAFAAGPGETCKSVILEMRPVGATDTTPGTLIRSTGEVTPVRDSGVGIYRVRLTGVPIGTEGRFRLKPRSSTDKQGPWTSLEGDDAWVRLVTTPAAPRDIVVTPYTSGVHVLGTIASADPNDYVTGAQAVVTLIPQGTVAEDTGERDIGGTTRRADLDLSTTFADGQQTSTVLRLRNKDGVWSRWSAPVLTTMREQQGPALTPSPGRLLTVRPTFTITDATFDGWRLRLLHETDDDIELYDSGGTTVTNQTSVSPQIPAGVLTYGQRFRAVVSTLPDGGSEYGPESIPQTYSIAGLPTSVLSVPDAVAGKVSTQTPTWRRTVTDPDGGTITATFLEVNAAAIPQGTGTRITKLVQSGPTRLDDVVVPTLTIPWETSVDARLWARNDITALAGTTLSGAVAAGALSVTVASTSNMSVGQRIQIVSATPGRQEERTIATLPGGNVITFLAPLEWAHLSGETVSVYVPGPISPWVTITAMQPPDVDLLTPADGATVTRPWQALDWVATLHGGRAQASAVVTIRDTDEQVVGSIEVSGTATAANVPAFLLEDATTYSWDVTVTDTQGMETTSAERTFVTAFVAPDPLSVVSAEDADGAIVVSWGEVTDPDLHHIEVSWQADDGSWVRIDGGPEGYGDGLPAFTGSTLTHIGARLGSNTYSVRPHNGWRGADPVNGSATLGWSDLARGSWEVVRGDGELTPVQPSDAPTTTDAMVDLVQPPGGVNQALHWGIGARRISMRAQYIPAEDGPLATTLRLLMADPIRGRVASPAWVRGPAGYLVDPLWCVLTTFTTTPGGAGISDLSMEWCEVADPVHAILPPAPEAPAEGVPDIFTDLGELDFGDVVEEEV